ncbi:MAG TPA: hypothetical protein VK488_05240 [Gaiellaceae bacterium]|nr:hypothetical protein [Gaiellaceae bacterium]
MRWNRSLANSKKVPLDPVRIETSAGIVEISEKLSGQLRGGLIAAGRDSTERQLHLRGTNDAIILDRTGKRDLLGIVRVVMNTTTDEVAESLLPLRNALRADLEGAPVPDT